MEHIDLILDVIILLAVLALLFGVDVKSAAGGA
jgi:hypothetical protein